MKKSILGFISFLLCTAAAGSLCSCSSGGVRKITPAPIIEDAKPDLTILHIDAEKKDFQKFIKTAEEELKMQIKLESCPSMSDNRHALISTLLSSGDSSVDLISVNDEMVTEFKTKDYLYPLEEVMTEEVKNAFTQEYLQDVCMDGEKIYSVPYLMDIMVFWVNQELLSENNLESLETFDEFRKLKAGLEDSKYVYGDSWEKSYAYNSLFLFTNAFGGNYMDWSDSKTKEAATFMKQLAESEYTPSSQVVDQYEQMIQKFMEGKYGCIFMYTGAVENFQKAAVYGADKLHIADFPDFLAKDTNIATWQYVLNKASKNKENAIRFLQYAASKKGSIAFARSTGKYPARLDVIRDEDLNLYGQEEVREYLKKYRLHARPLCDASLDAVSAMGTLFQQYILNRIDDVNFFTEAQNVIDEYYASPKK